MNSSALAHAYARDVDAGKITIGRYALLACKRFLADLRRAEMGEGPFRFDWDRADAAINFQQTLPHTKGEWAGRAQLLVYEPWQCFIEANIFGWVYRDNHPLAGLRRFRETYEEVARKNGKSIRLAARGLYMLCADGEYGAEVYSGAGTERQAWEVFRPARDMVRRNEELASTFDVDVNAKSLIIMSNGSRFEPMIGKPGDGASPSFYICDEYHEHADASQYETMITGMGARRQPLASIITTAGVDLGGPCFEKRQDVIRVLEGTATDESLFGIIYCADEGDQWDSEVALEKANPNLGVSVSREFLLSQMEKARRSASLQNAFKTKHLNLWVGASVSWMNMLAWQRQKRDMEIEQFCGQTAYLAVDLASKKDLAALGILIPNGREFNVFCDFFVPESAVEENDVYRRHPQFLTVTPGNATDYGFIEERIRELCGILAVREIAFDQWQAQYLAQRLIQEGLPMIEFPHQVRTMSDPMKEVEALVLDGRLFHDGNPLLTWCAGNVVVRQDAKENVYPTKERKNDERCKIDGMVALIMAMGRYLATQDGGSFDAFLANPVRVG